MEAAALLLWPDNESAVSVFEAMSTQWQVGMSGVVGLNYSSLPIVFRMLKISAKYQSDIFESLRIMEGVALTEMHKGK